MRQRRDVAIARRHPRNVYRTRWLICAAAALVFFGIALSNEIYNLTSPPALTWHVLLRKSYSIVAFGLVGALYVWASGASLVRSVFAVAAYSGAIEVGQGFVNHFTEPYVWNAIDVACGAIGGAIGAIIPGIRAR